MRHGYYAKLAFTGSGNLVAFGTGSDACAEHECGSKELQEALSGAYGDEAALVAALRAGEQVEYPSVIDRKRITKNLDKLQFIEVPGRGEEPPQAILGYVDGGTNLMYFKRELEFPSDFMTTVKDKDVSGAWAADSFAIRVRGKKYVKALKRFHEAMKEGHVVFAGTFYRDTDGAGRYDRLSGVILADLRYLDDVSRANMAKAQAKYESDLRLKARDDSRALMQEMDKLTRFSFMHVWAVWKDAAESEVMYALNPGQGMNAPYYGPYTRQQLLKWAKAGYHTPLVSTPKEAVSA